MPAKYNRRTFVSQAAAASTALAVWSETRAFEDRSANSQLVVAIMGTNGRGQALARGFARQANCQVAYICDVDQRAIGKGIEAVGEQKTASPIGVQDFRRALDDRAVDALVVATPDHWHAPATILACSAGKHVYVEKPACHNGREGEMMVAAARKNQRVVQLGTQRRSSTGMIEAIKRVHQAEFGRVLLARGWINSTRPSIGHGKEAPVPAYLDYSLWQGPAPERPYRDNLIHYNWHWFWNWGTGELGNNGIHSLDVCRWGLQVDYPHSVVCGGGRFHFDDDQETPDTQIVTYNFGDKAINWEHRTWSRRGFEGDTFGVVFYGEAGSMVITGSGYKIYDMDGKTMSEGAVKTEDGSHIGNFLTCVREAGRPNAEIEEGVKSTQLCHLGNIAYRTGRTARFDPQAKRIVGDEEQLGLWGREYRPGWQPVV